MPVVAYIANEFPSALEPYVLDEIGELRSRGAQVIAATVRAPKETAPPFQGPVLEFLPLRPWTLVLAAGLLLSHAFKLRDLFVRILLRGREPLSRRLRCLLHTFMGAYFAVLLKPSEVDHVHAHHGYFSSWIAMVAARLLNVGFSLTLHGSDLLLHPAYLDTKLRHCSFCVTISDFNRRHILKTFPQVDPAKLIVQHLGVDAPLTSGPTPDLPRQPHPCLVLLAVGRLHPVKDHAFLVNACARLRARGFDVFCLIAGEGHERPALEKQIAALRLDDRVTLLGHIPRADLDPYYALADVVVLTSRSEGIPIVLMEAMARGKLVLAPAITGIPELVRDSETGFLYEAGNLDCFVESVERLCRPSEKLDLVRRAARQHVLDHFHRETNLRAFGNLFIARIRQTPVPIDEDPLLQQI